MAQPIRKGRAPGPLMILTLLLAVSGGIRLFSGPVAALATDVVPEEEAAAHCVPDKNMDLWIAELMERDDRISAAEADLAREREELAAAKELIREQFAALQAAQDDLRRNLHAAGETAAGDVSQLTDVYQRMKPKEAAAIFEKMDPQFAAGFLARMKPDVAAEIMAGLRPDTAYTFSAILAGRNASLASQTPPPRD